MLMPVRAGLHMQIRGLEHMMRLWGWLVQQATHTLSSHFSIAVKGPRTPVDLLPDAQ